MDFIEQLPLSLGFTSILIVVDRLQKQCIFIPTHNTIMSPELTKLFLLHIFSKHRAPSHMTSNRGLEFISHFFQSLRKALDIRLHFTSRHHPEGDSQTKRMNQTLEQYLHIYSTYQQDNWSELLPLTESLCHIPNIHLRILSSTECDRAFPRITASPEYSDSD